MPLAPLRTCVFLYVITAMQSSIVFPDLHVRAF